MRHTAQSPRPDNDFFRRGRTVISFVGAGPGAADLVTLRGARRLAAADVIVWASSLVPAEILTHANPAASVHDSASMTLERVLGVYEAALRDNPDAVIVRLHSGDPSLYGALYEQIKWCVEHAHSFEIVPGVSSLAAAAAALNCELTVPAVSQSVVLTRLPRRTRRSVPDNESVEALAAHGTTMAVFLSGARPAALQKALLADGAGYPPSTPAAVVLRASRPDEVVRRTTVGELAATMKSIDATLTALVLVGPAIGFAHGGRDDSPASPTPVIAAARSRLYSPDFSHRHRVRSASK